MNEMNNPKTEKLAYESPSLSVIELDQRCNLLVYLSVESDIEDFEEGEW